MILQASLLKSRQCPITYLVDNASRLSLSPYITEKSIDEINGLPFQQEHINLLQALAISHENSPLLYEIEGMLLISKIITELGALLNRLEWVTNSRMIDETSAITQLQILEDLTPTLFETYKKHSDNFENLNETSQQFLKSNADLGDFIHTLSYRNRAETTTQMSNDISNACNRFYTIIANARYAKLKSLEQNPDNLMTHAKKHLLLFDIFPGSKTLLHIAVLAEHYPLCELILSQVKSLRININMKDNNNHVAMQPAVDKKNLPIIDLFLQHHPDVTKIKAPDGKKLFEHIPKITSLGMLVTLESHPYRSLIIYNFIQCFFEIDRLQPKMEWLLNYNRYTRILLLHLEMEDSRTRDYIKRIHYTHLKCLPVRMRLCQILELNEHIHFEADQNTTLFFTESNDFNPHAIMNLEKTKIVLLEDLLKEFNTLLLQYNSYPKMPEKLRMATIEVCRYNIGFIEDLTNYLIGQQILLRHPLFENKSSWQQRLKEAHQNALSNHVKLGTYHIRQVIKNSYSQILLASNLEKLEVDHLYPIVYSEKRQDVPIKLRQFEDSWHICKPTLVMEWCELQDTIASLVDLTTVQERKTKLFGPIFAELHLESLLHKTNIALDQVSDQSAINNLIYGVLIASTTPEYETLFFALIETLEEVNQDLSNLWKAQHDDVLLFISNFKIGTRAQQFQHLFTENTQTLKATLSLT